MNNQKKKVESHNHFPEERKSETVYVKRSVVFDILKKRAFRVEFLAVGGGFLLGIVASIVVLSLSGSSISSTLSLQRIQISPQEYFADTKPQRYVILDLRSTESFHREHLSGSLSVPVTLQNGEIVNLEGIKSRIGHLDHHKTLILLGENSFSRTPYLLYSRLHNEGGYDLRIMNTGWNEIRHLATFWLSEDQWGTFQIEDHIVKEIN